MTSGDSDLLPDPPTHPTPWIKAQASNGGGGNCVEVRRRGGVVEVRDSKDPSGPVLRFTPAEFAAFLDGARNAEFDHLAG